MTPHSVVQHEEPFWGTVGIASHSQARRHCLGCSTSGHQPCFQWRTAPPLNSTVIGPRTYCANRQTDPTAWYEFRYDTVAAEQGYATYVGTLSCEGAVIAWTEQLAAIFA